MEIMKIEQQMKKALNNWGVTHTNAALAKITAEWYTQKSYLRDILSKHPLWREDEQAIVFNYTQKRDFDIEVYREAIGDFYRIMDYYCPPKKTNLWVELMSVFAYQVTGKLATKELVDDLYKITGEKFSVGTKYSRIFNKLILPLFEDNSTALAIYNHYFARVADAMNPIEIKKYTCLSIHPADFLNMSNGTGWRSCHAMDGGGWQAGCLSYLLDDCSMILYTVSSNFDEEHGNFCFEPKIDRQIYCFDKYNRLLQSRLYPQDNEKNHIQSNDFRHLVQEILTKCLEIPNLWVKLKDDSFNHFKHSDIAALYPDWEYTNYYTNVSVPKNTDLSAATKTIVGAAPMCLECGNSFNGSIETDELYCSSCGNYSTNEKCVTCGQVEDSDYMYLINGEWYCNNCVFWCDWCKEYEPIADLYTEVDDFGLICEDAYISNPETFAYCECCDTFFLKENALKIDGDSDEIICPNCGAIIE